MSITENYLLDRNASKRKICSHGFSLLELLTVIFILIGVFCLTFPYTKSFINQNTIEDRVNTITNAIKFARNKAQLAGKNLVLSELTDEDGWMHGMQLFVDNTGNFHFEKGDELIREWRWNDASATVAWHGFTSDHYLLFNADLKSASLNGYFTISQKGAIKRKIIINRLGRVKVEQ
jgi:Tfp pilus assembly protein FimT